MKISCFGRKSRKRGVWRVKVRIKGKDRVYVSGKEAVWKGHFEHLMNDKTEREAIVSSMDVEAGGKCECAEGWERTHFSCA